MLNKKDPLIESVQKIMLENEIRRTVTKNLNEELGIQSINNLPHELHEKYTAILEQNITAALLDEKVQMTKQQFASLDGKPEFTGRDLELARAGHHKKLAAAGKLEEQDKSEADVTSPSSIGIKKPDYATGTPDYAKDKVQTVNLVGKGNNLAPGMGRAENIAKQGDSVVTRTGKNSSSVSPSTMKEEQLNELSPGTYAGYLAKADSDVDTAQEFNRTYYRKPETGRRAILSKYNKGIERATSSLYKKGMSSKEMEDAVRSARKKIPDMEPKKILPRNVKEEQFDENWGDKPPKSEREGYSKDPEDGKWKPTHKIGKKLKQKSEMDRLKEDYDSKAKEDKRKNKKYIEKREKHGLKSDSWRERSNLLNKKAVTGMKVDDLGEEITGKTDIGDAIRDFRASKSKQLAGRSSEERRKAAIAAVLQARREKK
jgi:hypothetical protein